MPSGEPGFFRANAKREHACSDNALSVLSPAAVRPSENMPFSAPFVCDARTLLPLVRTFCVLHQFKLVFPFQLYILYNFRSL